MDDLGTPWRGGEDGVTLVRARGNGGVDSMAQKCFYAGHDQRTHSAHNSRLVSFTSKRFVVINSVIY